MRPGCPQSSTESLRRVAQNANGQTPGPPSSAFWRLVIASALNAEIDTIALALCGLKVVRETVHETQPSPEAWA